MSTWYNVKEQEDVEVSNDGETLDILFATDEWGNKYVEIPIEFVKKALEEYDKERNKKA